MSFFDGADQCLATVFSLSGTKLTDKERGFFKEISPFGFILFARNCEEPDQLQALTQDLKESVGRDCPILIDQEGGRVQRLKPPIWRHYPAAQTFGAHAENDLSDALDDVRFTTLQIAEELRAAGINVNCAPVLDVLTPQTHEAIGDRAFSDDPEIVARLGLSVCRNFLASNIMPVIKHLPGHGRAAVDSHKDLPRVEASSDELDADFYPFKEVASSDIGQAVWGMVAHVVYEALDPNHPASVSDIIIGDIIRKEIGFEGMLLSDDLDMEALKAYGDVSARALASLQAGCDLALYCAGKLSDMEKIAESVPKLSPKTLQRLQKAAEFTKIAA